MKKLIFIDNDSKERGQDELSTIKITLELFGNLDKDYIETIQTISNFHQLPREKASELIFSGGNIICTYSMYTSTHYGSFEQFINFLLSAASNRVEGIVYLDMSGKCLRALDRYTDLPDSKLRILQAIYSNYIITRDEDGNLVRVLVDIKEVDESCFKVEPIILKDLLELLS